MSDITDRDTLSAADEIIKLIDDGFTEWDEICFLLDEDFPNGSIPSDLLRRLDELAQIQQIDITFDPERGWSYQDLFKNFP